MTRVRLMFLGDVFFLIHAVAEGTDSVQCIVEQYVFFNVIAVDESQLPDSHENGFFCFSDAMDNLGPVRLKQGSLIEQTPGAV